MNSEGLSDDSFPGTKSGKLKRLKTTSFTLDSEHNTRLDCITPEREAALARFWECYIENIHNQGVTKPFDRWYVIRAQAYIDARPGLRLKTHQASDLTDYLNALGRKSGLKAW